MKIRRIATAACAAVMALSLTGCQLAKEELAEAKSQDRLVGVLITDEHLDLFDIEGYLNDHIGGFSGGGITLDGGSEKYNGRLYASLLSRELTDEETGKKSSIQEYVFDKVEGIPFFVVEMQGEDGESYTASNGGEGISESHIGSYYGDDEDKNTMEGTIYLIPGESGRAHYINPVYQTADGRVYATSGQGASVEGIQSQGEVLTQKFEESVTVTENGKSKKKTTVISIAIRTMLPPEKIVLLEMDKNSAILSTKEYEPGKLPESITPDKDTDYILLESHGKGFDTPRKITRALFTKENQSLESFYPIENGIVIKQYTTINWKTMV